LERISQNTPKVLEPTADVPALESDASLEDIEPAFCDEPPTPLKNLEESVETTYLAGELVRLKGEFDLQI
jgi:hypothetical protein